VTASVKQRNRRRSFQGRRRARLYAYMTFTVDRRGMILDGSLEVGYIGQTVQTLAARDGQHNGMTGPDGTPMVCQPWYDVVGGGILLIAEGFWTQAELDEREVYWIHRLKPRYNIEHNLQNKNRITKAQARRHREARCKARGVTPPLWDRPETATPSRSRLRRLLRRQATWWTLAVAVLFGAYFRLLGTDRQGVLGALVLTAATVTVVAWMTAPGSRNALGGRSRRRR
jgi:hypothetical protein